MFALEIFLASSWTFFTVMEQCLCEVTPRDPYSVENVILARRVVNEVHMRDVNLTNDPQKNETMQELNKYLHNNPAAQELLKEDREGYEDGARRDKEESEHLEDLIGSGLIPFMFERCNKSYTVNHMVMYNVSLQYDVGNNSLVPFDTPGDRIRIAFMKFQDYINRMNQWSRKLVKGGSFTLKKVERDTFCTIIYKSNYTNSINNTRLITAFETDLQEQVSHCLNNIDKMFAPHFAKVQEALLANPIYPKYVPLGKDLQEKFIMECNLYNPVREKLWHHLMAEPANVIYRESFKTRKDKIANAAKEKV